MNRLKSRLMRYFWKKPTFWKENLQDLFPLAWPAVDGPDCFNRLDFTPPSSSLNFMTTNVATRRQFYIEIYRLV